MFDGHYDLLTILYLCYLKKDFTYVEEISKNFNKNNVEGLIANLYFMSEEEMQEEFGNYYDKNISVLEMFKIATNLYHKYFKDTKVIFSIEGADYIKDTKELEELYNLGLRNILIVWNNKNKYASGNNTSLGLTELGEVFIKKAIDLGISIDLSHTNEASFFAIIEVIKKEILLGKKPIVIASHSNCYSLCPVKRNLKDEQLKAIKEVNGKVGLVGYGPFIDIDNNNLKLNYLKHINYAVNILGVDNIFIATDDMDFATTLYNIEEGDSVFSYNNIKEEVTKILSTTYNSIDIKKILRENIERDILKEEK